MNKIYVVVYFANPYEVTETRVLRAFTDRAAAEVWLEDFAQKRYANGDRGLIGEIQEVELD